MKKFTFKGVLDGFRSSVQAAPRGTEQEIQETLRPDHFQIKKVSGALRSEFPQAVRRSGQACGPQLGGGGDRLGWWRIFEIETLVADRSPPTRVLRVV